MRIRFYPVFKGKIFLQILKKRSINRLTSQYKIRGRDEYMNFARIAWKDISSIFKKRFIRFSVIAVVIVPLLYSLLYLAAFWDPYSKLGQFPVAVINLDKGGENEGKQANYGNDMVNELKKNKDVEWHFVSLGEAETGLTSNKYYSMFVIPEDFTKKVMSAKDGRPEVPSIKYCADEKKNYLASQISDKIEKNIKEKMASTISKEYTKVTFDKLYELKDGMEKAAVGSKELYDGSSKLNDNIPKMVNGIEKLADGSNELKNKTAAIPEGVSNLATGSAQITEGLGRLKDNTAVMIDGMARLSYGASNFNKGLLDANNGSAALSDGIEALYGGFSTQVLPGINVLNKGAKELSAGLAAAKPAADALHNGVYGAGTTNGLGLISGANELANGASALQAGQDKINTGTTQLPKASKELVDGDTNLINKYDELVKGYKSISSGVLSLVTSVEASQKTIGDVDSNLKSFLVNNPSAANDPNMKKILEEVDTLRNSRENNGLSTLLKEMSVFDKALSNFKDNGITFYTSKVNAYIKGINQVLVGVDDFTKGANSFVAGTKGYSDGAKSFADGAKQLADRIQLAVDGSSKLSSGLNLLYINLDESDERSFGSGLKNITSGASKLNEGISQLYEGSSQLDGGLGQLNKSVSPLIGAIGRLHDGSSQVSGGLGQLNSGIPPLVDAIGKVNSGLIELNGRMPELEDGSQKLNNGSKELANKLREGSDKINISLKNSSEEMGKFVSEPITMSNASINVVKNYGTGFAPYFISISLWVGAIIMFFVISPNVADGMNAGPISKVIGKYLSYSFIGLLQAILVSIAVLILGLKPNNMIMYFVVNIMMSLAFIAIIQSLIFILGDGGRLIAMIIFVIQLTSSAGTFPIQVLPQFFKILYPYMPFTYAIASLREAISGWDISIILFNTSILIAILVVFLIISIALNEIGEKFREKIEVKKEQLEL